MRFVHFLIVAAQKYEETKSNQRQMNNPFLSGIALAFALSFVSGCATHSNKQPAQSKNRLKDRPETVLVTYHVKPGMEKQFEALLDRAWNTYRSEGMVKSEPHVIVRD